MQGNHFVSMYGSQVEGSFETKLAQQLSNLAERKIDRSKVYKFQNKASGIILIKQDYKQLFYNPNKKLQFPLDYVQLLFFTKKDSEFETLKIILSNNMIEIDYTRPQIEGDKIVERTIRQEFKFKQILFPTPQQAPLMFQKKIWVQLNRLNRTLSIYSGDVVNFKGQKPLVQKVFSNQYSKKEGWNNQAQKFMMPTYNQASKEIPKKIIEPFTELQFFFVKFKVNQPSEAEKKKERKINDYVTLQVLNLSRIFDPVIESKVSLLKPTLANLQSMPPPLRNLYECLSNLDVRKLPDFTDKSIGHDLREEYLNWKGLQFALHHSLITPYDLTSDGTPIGIMNHLYKMKCKREYKNLQPFMKQGNQKFYLNKDQIMDEIYNNRAGYIRLELLPHEGLGPGSMAVLEVWPPYHCSSIHNHGDAYGLIKVLSGSIRVQNYSQLAFSAIQGTPYLENDYEQDQYTWLSELSFGIHRLVNVKPQTCLTLQSYYHNQITAQYFSVVKKINGVFTYIEYYPQNDWVNYLNESQNKENDSKDINFIKKVITKYGLTNNNGKLDTSFQRLALALKQEYEYFHKLLATEFHS